MVHTDHVLLDTSILSPHPLPPSVPSLVDVYILLLLRIEASGGEYLSQVLVSSAIMVDCCDFFCDPRSLSPLPPPRDHDPPLQALPPSSVPFLADADANILLHRIEASGGEYLSPFLVSVAMMVDCCDFFAIRQGPRAAASLSR